MGKGLDILWCLFATTLIFKFIPSLSFQNWGRSAHGYIYLDLFWFCFESTTLLLRPSIGSKLQTTAVWWLAAGIRLWRYDHAIEGTAWPDRDGHFLLMLFGLKLWMVSYWLFGFFFFPSSFGTHDHQIPWWFCNSLKDVTAPMWWGISDSICILLREIQNSMTSCN